MKYITCSLLLLALAACSQEPETSAPKPVTEDEWKAKLTPEQYNICREKGTEMPGSGKYLSYKGDGKFACVACGAMLFDGKTKYESNSGWPSFWKSIDKDAIRYEKDMELGYERTEILCAKCGSHLGHVFNDGPQPTGKRYCVNSVSLQLIEEEEGKKEKKDKK